MITVKDAWIMKGFSGNDHLNGGVDEFIGLEFRSVGEARETIYRASRRNGSNVTRSPIGLEVLFADGTTKKIA